MGQRQQDATPDWLVSLPDLSDRQFHQWASLLERRVGVAMPDSRRSFLTTGLKLRMREIGCRDYQEYYDRLLRVDGTEEWLKLVDRLTVHETRFFRHPPSLALLRTHGLPSGPDADACPHSYQAWSVGCSTGEEAYTLAMIIEDHFRNLGGQYYYGITASDISLAALEFGRHGRYPLRRLDGIRADLQERYCESDGPEHFRIASCLRRRVCFSQLNVLDVANVPYGKMDLVVCQNLLIYFERERRIEIVSNLAVHLRQGGLLILGPGELVDWVHPKLERIRFDNTLAFRRSGAVGEAREAK